MVELLVRNVSEDLAEKLELLAAEHGVSAEEEHLRILRAALRGDEEPDDFKEHLLSAPLLAEEDEWMFDRNDPRNKHPERAPINFDD